MIPEWMDQYMSMAALNITWSDVVEILILAFIIYHVMIWTNQPVPESDERICGSVCIADSGICVPYEHDPVDCQELLQSWNYGGHCSISAGNFAGPWNSWVRITC